MELSKVEIESQLIKLIPTMVSIISNGYNIELVKSKRSNHIKLYQDKRLQIKPIKVGDKDGK